MRRAMCRRSCGNTNSGYSPPASCPQPPTKVAKKFLTTAFRGAFTLTSYESNPTIAKSASRALWILTESTRRRTGCGDGEGERPQRTTLTRGVEAACACTRRATWPCPSPRQLSTVRRPAPPSD